MNKNILYTTAITLTSLVLASCSSDTLPTSNVPAFDNTKNQATNIYRTGALLQGCINAGDNTKYDECGIMYSEYPDMTKAVKVPVKTDATVANRTLYANVDGLKSGMTYYYCAYATSGSTTVSGDVYNFTTPTTSAPTIVDTEVSDVKYTSCDVKSEVQDNGGTDLFLGGYIYKEVSSATDNTPFAFNDAGVNSIENDKAGTFQQTIPNLQPGSYYAVRAYGVSYGVGYGDVKVFQTPATTLPAVSTVTVSNLQTNGFSVTASIIASGTSDVTERGFCYSSDTKTPTTANNVSVVSGTTTDFSASLTGINPGMKCYVCAYAKNASGTGYGEVMEIYLDQELTLVHDTAYVYPDLSQFTTYAEVDNAISSALDDFGYNKVTTDQLKETLDGYATKDYADQVTKDNVASVYNQLTAELNGVSKTVDEVSAQAGQNKTLIDKMQAHYDSLFNENKISHETYEKALSSLNDKAKEQQSALDSLQKYVDELHDNIVSVQKQVDGLAEDYSALSSKLTDYEGSMKSLGDELTKQQKEIDALDKRVTDIENTLSQMKQSSPMPVVIDKMESGEVTDNAVQVTAYIDYASYVNKYNEVFGKNTLYGDNYYAELYPIIMTGFVYSTVFPEPNVEQCNKMIVVASPYTSDMKSFTASIPLLASDSKYYIRAFAINSYGTVYSEVVTVNVGPSETDNVTPSVVNIKRRM